MTKAPLGSGQRFAALVKELMAQGHSRESAEKIAAAHGRKRYGGERFSALAAAGRARHARPPMSS